MKNYVITIGRQFGSGGRALGRLIAEKLCIPFYDKELLMQAAEESGLNPNLLVKNDERMPRFISGSLSFTYGMSPMPWYSSTSISDDNLYRVQSDFIHKLASRGPCVIVGRSADYVLRDMENVIKVFVNAEMDDCVARIIERNDSVDYAKARKMAEKINKLRANYYNFYTDKRWGDAASYDICFNSSRIALADIADMVVDYLHRRLGE